MNEEIEYAEMLEIPVSTVNVIKKNHRKKEKIKEEPHLGKEKWREFTDESLPMKDTVIAQVNNQLNVEENSDLEEWTGELPSGHIDFDVPERIDTVRVYDTANKKKWFQRKKLINLFGRDSEEELENEGGMYALNEENAPLKGIRLALNLEFAAVCVLCAAIFLTNVFMPNSAVNTFFRALQDTSVETDDRQYTDFVLSSVVGDFSDTQITLSPTGILSFTDETCVYPTADGVVKEIIQSQDGTYLIKIAHSDTFTGVIGGLDYVYYAVGDTVKSHVPIGYSNGETEVQVTMYSGGELLNCFQLTEENCLAWMDNV